MNEVDHFENRLQDLEFQILVPTLALLSCAHSRAAELGCGFEFEKNSLKLVWPDEVMQGFGLKPTDVVTSGEDRISIKVRFGPILGLGRGYWRHIFSSKSPDLVVGYEVNDDLDSSEPPLVRLIDEEWLHWAWHVSKEDRLAAMEKAVAAFEQLSDAVGWANAAQRSAIDGPRSILFTTVLEYCSRDNHGRKLDG